MGRPVSRFCRMASSAAVSAVRNTMLSSPWSATRAAVGGEVVHPAIQRRQQGRPCRRISVPADCGKPGDIVGKVGLFQIYRLVRAEGRQHHRLQRVIGGQLLVPAEVVRRVIGGTQQSDVGLLQNVPHPHPVADDLLAVLPHRIGVARR